MQGEEVRVVEQPQDQPGRVDGRPDRLDRRLHRAVAGDGVLHAVVRCLTGALHLHQHGVRDPLRKGLAGGAVADVAVQQLPDDLLQLVHRYPPAPGAAHHDDRLVRRGHMGADRAPQHLGHPGVALDDGRGGRVGAAHLHMGDEVVHRGLPDLQLAQGGQHLLDVVQEGLVRTDDEGAGAGQPVPVGVEEVGDAVQADGGLPGTGTPWTQTLPLSPLRTISSCSGWMVATMSRMGPTRGRSISCWSSLLVAAVSAGSERCSSSYAVRSPPVYPKRRRSPTSIGSFFEAR